MATARQVYRTETVHPLRCPMPAAVRRKAIKDTPCITSIKRPAILIPAVSFTDRHVRSWTFRSHNKVKSGPFEYKHTQPPRLYIICPYTGLAQFTWHPTFNNTDAASGDVCATLYNLQDKRTYIGTFFIRFSITKWSVFYNSLQVWVLWAELFGKCARFLDCYQMHFIAPDTSTLPKYIRNSARCTVSKPNLADGGESCGFWRHSYAVTRTWHTERQRACVPNTGYMRRSNATIVTYADCQTNQQCGKRKYWYTNRTYCNYFQNQLSFIPHRATVTRWHKQGINTKLMNQTI